MLTKNKNHIQVDQVVQTLNVQGATVKLYEVKY